MKTASLFALLFCAIAFQVRAAEAPEYSAEKVEAIIALLPTVREMDTWNQQKAKNDPDWPTSRYYKELLPKMQNERERCQELLTYIKLDKSIFDYPGMLAIGSLTFDARKRSYTLKVVSFRGEDSSFGGFECTFSETGSILSKRAIILIL